MDVFVSWSGERSKKAASLLKDWITEVVPKVKPFFSDEDIAKGVKWLHYLSEQLKSSSYGIICLTKENVDKPWILFEAGALSTSFSISKVSPLLFDLDPSDVKGPLSQFQLTAFSKDDFKKLIMDLNAMTEGPIAENHLDLVFDNYWPRLQEGIAEVLKESGDASREMRSDRDILNELLKLTRAYANSNSTGLNHKMVLNLIEKLTKHSSSLLLGERSADSIATLKELRLPIEYIISLVQDDRHKSQIVEQYKIFRSMLEAS